MLVDSFDRKINYLRISVTSRCNFRCLYCMPNTPFSWEPKENLLSYEDMFEFIKIAIDNGITKIRLTGGEPLLRKDLDKFIKMIADYADIDLALTTNGYFLEKTAQTLKDAGLKRVNISLDSLNKETYRKIAQKDVFDNVIKGIQKAINVGLKVKLNSVLLKGINDNEIMDLYEYAKKLNIPIRYIEYMENNIADNQIKGISSQTILDEIKKHHSITPLNKEDNSPADYYVDEDNYKFGLIMPHSDDFCKTCNRIRLTAEGYLIPCLFFNESYQIKEAIKNKNIKEATNILKKVIIEKPEKNDWQNEVSDRAFYETGG
jgi:cyclic pyranopterin phosphate synthase